MKNNNCVVPTLSALYALQNHIEGECVYCEEDQKVYTWQEDGWGPLNVEGKGISMNLYDLNKSIVNQLPVMSNSEISEKMEIFNKLHNSYKNTHYMLLCKDYNYYTIFECDSMLNIPTFSAAVCEIISEIGDVYSIEFTTDEDAIEIWIKPTGIEEDEALAFYLFPYEAGVVYFG